MSLSRFHTGTGNFFDFDPLDGIPWMRGRHPLAPSEETHALKPRCVIYLTVPVSWFKYLIADFCGQDGRARKH